MSNWFVLLVVFVGLCVVWFFLIRSDNEFANKVGGWGTIVLGIFGVILWLAIPRVIVVEDGKQYSTRLIFFGEFTTDDGKEYQVKDYYIYNKSSEPLVIYPVDYGTSKYSKDVIIVEIDELKKGEDIDYFFEEAPSTISVSSGTSGATKWVLEYLSDALERFEEDTDSIGE